MQDRSKPIKGLGITREQLVSYLRSREEESSLRPEVSRLLYEQEDKTLITETPRSMIMPKIRMRLMLAATDPKRKVPLIQVFLEAYNEEMISLERQGRLELLGALQALTEGGSEEGRGITLGR